MSTLGIVTDGEQKIVAKPGERSKFEDGGFQQDEVAKFINDAKVTQRMEDVYLRGIFDDEEEEEGQGEEGDEPEEPEEPLEMEGEDGQPGEEDQGNEGKDDADDGDANQGAQKERDEL